MNVKIEWRNLSNDEKEKIRLQGKKHLKSIQKQICEKIICNTCPNEKFTSISMYKRHLESKYHLKRFKRSVIGDTWDCKLCNIKLPNESEWNKHSTGKKHHKTLKKYNNKHYPTTRPYLESDIQDLKQSDFMEEVEEDGQDLHLPLIG